MIRPTGKDLEIIYTKEDTESWDSHVQALNSFLSGKFTAAESNIIPSFVRQVTLKKKWLVFVLLSIHCAARANLLHLNPILPTLNQCQPKLSQRWLELNDIGSILEGLLWKVFLCQCWHNILWGDEDDDSINT